MNKKNILLTGATGDIGKQILAELFIRSEKYNIRILSRNSKKNRKLLQFYNNKIEIIWGDITSVDSCEQAVRDMDYVIHAAGVIPPVTDRDPQLAERVNVIGTKNIVKAIEQQKNKAKLIFTSSVTVYGDRLNSKWIKVGDPLISNSFDNYAITKIQAEEIIKKSTLDWTIFRLGAIMHPELKFTPLMFHMPLETSMEICSSVDTAFCLVQAIDRDESNKEIHNLGGGEKCRILYKDYLAKMFPLFGLKPNILSDNWFATKNFHCGYFSDIERTQEIFQFQRDTLDTHFADVKAAIPSWKRQLIKRVPPFLIRIYLKRMSEPYQAMKTDNKQLINRFTGEKK